MTVRALLSLTIFLSVGCASHEGIDNDKGGNEPGKTEPEKPEPPAKKVAAVSIASVSMIEDCPQFDPKPDEAPAKPAPGAMAPAQIPNELRGRQAVPADEAMGDVDPSVQGRFAPGSIDSCTQSTLQLAFSADGEDPGKFSIRSLTVIDPKTDKPVGTVDARLPTRWHDSQYGPWDETVPAGQASQASYKISVPSWPEVEKKIGTGSFGHNFVLEAQVEIDGQVQTIRSSQFPREEPHVVVT